MKAAVLNAYKVNDFDLPIETLADPEPGEGEILVRVAAAGVNPLDNMIARGEMRHLFEIDFPQVAGCELVGYAEKCGQGVTRFAPGDRVCARLPVSGAGAFATRCVVPEDALAPAPRHMTDVQAAAVPLAALAAAQALDLLAPRPGERLFIAGASGGFGQMAVPLAKARGLYVVAGGNGVQRSALEKLGADQFIDYRRQEFDDVLTNIDLVIDLLGGSYIGRELAVMNRGGRLVSLRGAPNRRYAKRSNLTGLDRVKCAVEGRSIDKLAEKHGCSYDFLLSDADGRMLAKAIAVLEDRGAVPSMDSTFAFHDVNLALRNVAHRGNTGKTVLVVDESICR